MKALNLPHPLYTLGYTGSKPDWLKQTAEDLRAIVLDIRFSPRSRVPHWTKGKLEELLGERYEHLPALGNRNYKGGPIDLVDIEAGSARIIELLKEHPLILLCACKDYRRCHRTVVAEIMAERYGVKVIHLPSPHASPTTN